jgi:hypothetical protein
VGHVTSRAPFRFERRVFVCEWPLLIGVTLDASGVRAGGEPCLLEFKAAMRIVAIAALHRAFKDLVVKRHTERRFHLAVATETKLRLACLLHADSRETRLLLVYRTDQNVRARQVFRDRVSQMRRMTIGAADIVAPVFAAPEIIVLFPARMAGETGFRNFFRRFVFEGDDLGGVSLFSVGFAGTVTRLAASYFPFPRLNPGKLRVGSVREGFPGLSRGKGK